jgi:hypothetical protein
VEKTEVLTRGGAEPEEEIRGGGGCSPPAARFLSPFSLSGRRPRTTNREEKREGPGGPLAPAIDWSWSGSGPNGRRALTWVWLDGKIGIKWYAIFYNVYIMHQLLKKMTRFTVDLCSIPFIQKRILKLKHQ